MSREQTCEVGGGCMLGASGLTTLDQVITCGPSSSCSRRGPGCGCLPAVMAGQEPGGAAAGGSKGLLMGCLLDHATGARLTLPLRAQLKY